MSRPTAIPLTRRHLLLTGAFAILPRALSGGAAAQETVSLSQFLALSARLLDVDAASLDREAAAKMLEGFHSVGHGPGLMVLATRPEVSGGTVANDVVAAWYSGIYPTSAGDALATYTDAQLWSALDYTKPFGSCGGETGYWAEPPAG